MYFFISWIKQRVNWSRCQRTHYYPAKPVEIQRSTETGSFLLFFIPSVALAPNPVHIFVSFYLFIFFYTMFSCSPVFCIQLHPTLFFHICFLFFYFYIFLSSLSKAQYFTCVSCLLDCFELQTTLLTSLFLAFLSFYLMFSCSPVVCLLDCLQSRPISLKHFRQPQHSPTLPYFGFHQVCFLRRTKCPKWIFIAIVIAEIILEV